MKYIFLLVYTPDDTKKDRIRKPTEVVTNSGPVIALKAALINVGLQGLERDFEAEFHSQLGMEDLSEGSVFVLCTNNGEWEVEWETVEDAEFEVIS